MYGIVKIGEQDVPMLAMASCEIYYKQIFNEDPIKRQSAEDFDMGDNIDFTMKVGFVMAKYAELKDRKSMMKLNFDNYVEWLDGFTHEDYMTALEDIRKIYEGQKPGESNPKNEEDE